MALNDPGALRIGRLSEREHEKVVLFSGKIGYFYVQMEWPLSLFLFSSLFIALSISLRKKKRCVLLSLRKGRSSWCSRCLWTTPAQLAWVSVLKATSLVRPVKTWASSSSPSSMEVLLTRYSSLWAFNTVTRFTYEKCTENSVIIIMIHVIMAVKTDYYLLI